MNEGWSEYLELLKKTLTALTYDESAWTLVRASPKQRIKAQFIKALGARDLALVKVKPFNEHDRIEGRDWPFFAHTMVGKLRLDNVQYCIQSIVENNIPGDIIETGAWRGGTTIFMRACLKALGVSNRTVWVADSFEGLPPADDPRDTIDLSNNDYLAVSLERVQDTFSRYGLLDDQVRFLKGWFSETLPEAPINRLAILRLDGDMYSSTMDALTALYEKVSPGGFVIVDDYYTWEPCRHAVHDYLSEHGIDPEFKRIDFTGVYWQLPADT